MGGYSLGMRKKLLLARALLHEPPILYLDEPTANLDIHSCDVVHRILRGLVARGTTVLLTTHNMKEVEKVNQARFDAGRVAVADLAETKFYRIQAEIWLERAKAK